MTKSVVLSNMLEYHKGQVAGGKEATALLIVNCFLAALPKAGALRTLSLYRSHYRC